MNFTIPLSDYDSSLIDYPCSLFILDVRAKTAVDVTDTADATLDNLNNEIDLFDKLKLYVRLESGKVLRCMDSRAAIIKLDTEEEFQRLAEFVEIQDVKGKNLFINFLSKSRPISLVTTKDELSWAETRIKEKVLFNLNVFGFFYYKFKDTTSFLNIYKDVARPNTIQDEENEEEKEPECILKTRLLDGAQFEKLLLRSNSSFPFSTVPEYTFNAHFTLLYSMMLQDHEGNEDELAKSLGLRQG